MKNLLQKICAIFAAVSLFFPFNLINLIKTEAASDNLNKTVEYFIGQDNAVNGNGVLASLPSFTINIPEGSPVVTSAIIEINGVSYNDSGVDQAIMADLQRNALDPNTEPSYVYSYTLGGTNGKPRPFTIKYNALENNTGSPNTGAMSDINTPNTDYIYRLYLKDTVASGTVNFSVASAKLTLTYYNSSSAGANILKTNKIFIVQEKGGSADGAEAIKDFTISISEQSPAIQSVFIEVTGIAKAIGAGNGTVSASVTDQGAPANYADYGLSLGGAGNISKFIVRYDASAVILSADFPGGKTYTLRLKGAGLTVNLWNAKAIITYKYTVSLGGLPPKGELISSTINTEIAKGAAYNSVMWQGNLNGGDPQQVGIQIATSDSDAGPWTFKGPNCSTSASYNANPDTPIEISCVEHNNKQYFRYKVIICSSLDCSTPGSVNPTVNSVVVNWAP